MSQIKIVVFKNGKFGIRKRDLLEQIFNFGGVFRDFKPEHQYWREPCNKFFDDCQLDRLEDAKDWLAKVENKYVIKVLDAK